jgi:hypothetical protein
MTFLSMENFLRRDQKQIVIENWLYHPADSLHFRQRTFNDRDWEIIHPVLAKDRMPDTGWDGIGWFRTHFIVDSSLWGVPLGFIFENMGAAEIYLDGDSLFYFGKVSESAENEETFWQRNPRYIVFNDRQSHVVAIRYSNTEWQKFHEYKRGAGFNLIIIKNLLAVIDNWVKVVRDLSVIQIAFSIIPAILMVIHLFLFVFYRTARENLYYAICMFCWAGIGLIDFNGPFYNNWQDILIISMIGSQLVVPAIFFGLLTIYSGIYGRIPRQIYFFLFVGIILNYFRQRCQ